MDGFGDILELSRAEVRDGEVEPSLDLPISLLGKTDRAGLGDPFQPRCDIDAIAHEVAVALLDHVANVDADAVLDPLLGRHACVALGHAELDFDCAGTASSRPFVYRPTSLSFVRTRPCRASATSSRQQCYSGSAKAATASPNFVPNR
jgi:hypothetical protein